MRPLRLALTGFTCFRDFTEIDFSNLELFAIVGQTGAGKSSILDAICFALFEQTPRLGSKPAKELIAQGSTGMSLALEFEASDGQVYRVARTYSSKSSEVRFERFEQDKWLTAIEQTKKKEVAEAIERVVGLDFEGFTRAVLLPQGEFDRFLRGEPKQRRDLLKNLIGLERIEAMQKRSGEIAREAKAKSEMLQVQLETTLAAATPDALELLSAAQSNQQQQLEMVVVGLERARTGLLEAREIARLQSSLEAANAEVQQLQLATSNIAAYQERAVQARRVASALPLLEAVAKLETRVQHSRGEVLQAEQAVLVANQLEQQKRNELETARDAALEAPQLEVQVAHLTALIPRVERLQALGGTLQVDGKQVSKEVFSEKNWSELERFAAELPLLERIAKQLREIERQRTELGQVAMRLEAARVALQDRQSQLEQAQQQQSKETQQLEVARVAAQQIPELEQQLRQLEALKPKLQRLKELGGQLTDADAAAPVFAESTWTRLETVQSELKTHTRLLKQAAEYKLQLENARDELLGWEAQVLESQTMLETVLADGKATANEQKILEAALEAAKRENIGAELTRGLNIGDPCPVCYAPLKVLPDLTTSNVPAAEAAVQAGLLKVSYLRDEYARLKEATKNQAENQIRASKEVEQLEKNWRETNLERQQLEQSWQDVLPDISDPKSAVQQARAWLLAGLAAELTQAGATDFVARTKHLQTEKAQLEANERLATERLAETRAAVARIESALSAAQTLLESRETEQKNAQQEGLRLEQQRIELEHERKTFMAKLEARLGANLQPSTAIRQAQQALLTALATELLEAGASQTLEADIENLKTQRHHLELQERNAREALANAKTNLVALQSACKAVQDVLHSLEQETQAAQTAAQTALEFVGLSDATAAKALALSETEITQLEQAVQNHGQQLHSAQQRQFEILQELRGRNLQQPLATLEQQATDFEQQSHHIRAELGRLEAQKTVLSQQIQLAKELRREQNNLEKRFDIYQSLALDMKGNEFQDYLLAGVQQQLLKRASQTMRTITQDRYALELINAEFHVRDAWNGLEARGVKTLSGGESFIASLSLALSLSDYLAGSQALGALFLDEGFGTLDANALEMVANTLENLNITGRMVGVITHVAALAERLPMRLLIEKAQDSSRIRWE